MSNKEYVILVDHENNEIGKEEKLAAHQQALLHRAFSVFLYRKRNSKIEILLQQREKNKYHCGGLWANTCCSHPRQGEEILAAGKRRLKEEVGIHLEDALVDVGWFHYKAEFENGLTEHEIDHVLIGAFDEELESIAFNPEEVETLRWMTLDEVTEDMTQHLETYSPWFPLALAMACKNVFDKLKSPNP
jgi:isopentenyl-diphosphate Delta-isomerase